MFVVPIENTFLYVKPIYLEAEIGSIPEVRMVVVAYGVQGGDGVRIAYQPTLEEALEELFGPPADVAVDPGDPADPGTPVDPGTPQPPAPPPPAPGDPTVAELIHNAVVAFERAQYALQRGDWATYGHYMEQVEMYLQRLQEATR
jgi:hypothetical protein